MSAGTGVIGGEFLKADRLSGLLEGDEWTVASVDGRPTNRENAENGILGAAEGRFGIDLPTTISGRPFVVTIATFGADYARLHKSFGEDLDAWTNRKIAVGIDPKTGYVFVAPVEDGKVMESEGEALAR